MKIEEMLPRLDADAIATVRVNALRLISTGTSKQKDQANAALALIDTEMARRETEQPTTKPAKAKRARKAAAGA